MSKTFKGIFRKIIGDFYDELISLHKDISQKQLKYKSEQK